MSSKPHTLVVGEAMAELIWCGGGFGGGHRSSSISGKGGCSVGSTMIASSQGGSGCEAKILISSVVVGLEYRHAFVGLGYDTLFAKGNVCERDLWRRYMML